MLRTLTPILFFLSALALFFGYTDPAYQSTLGIRSKIADYESAISNSDAVRIKRDSLRDARNAIDPTNLDQLQKLLPDSVDNVRLILDISSIAAKHGLTLRSVKFGQAVTESSAGDGASLGSIPVGFSVSASYDNFLSFLTDLESSLRLVEITNLSLKTTTPTAYDYDLTLKTFWLKNSYGNI